MCQTDISVKEYIYSADIVQKYIKYRFKGVCVCVYQTTIVHKINKQPFFKTDITVRARKSGLAELVRVV